MATTLTRADCAIAMRNALADAAKRRAAFDFVPGFKLEPGVFAAMLRQAYFEIRMEKARAEREAEAARLAALPVVPAHKRRWVGPQHLLDARELAELEVLRWEMADAFTFEGNSRLFAAKDQLRAIEAQLTWKEIA